MYKPSDFTKNIYTVGDLAKIFNVSVKTIQNWDKAGKLKITRSCNGRRAMLKNDLLEKLDSLNMLENNTKRSIIYARVYSEELKDSGELDKQAMAIFDFVKDISNFVIIREVGSSIDDYREGITKIINMVVNDEVDRIYIISYSKLATFGYGFIDIMCKAKGVEVIKVPYVENKSNVDKEKRSEKSRVMDIMARW